MLEQEDTSEQLRKENVNLLVCSANMGNQEPDQDSLDAWIPRDGLMVDALKDQPYPLNGDKLQKTYPVKKSEKFDIIVIGMQEATFDVETAANNNYQNSEATITFNESLSTMTKNLLPNAYKAQKAVTDLTKSKNHIQPKSFKMAMATNISGIEVNPRKPSSLLSLSARRSPKPLSVPGRSFAKTGMESGQSARSLKGLRREPSDQSLILEDISPAPPSSDRTLNSVQKATLSDTKTLHRLLQEQLPSYEHAVSYQRGQMRLLLYFNADEINLEVLSVKAQNTGKGGLANKGGIVTEVKVNGTTRLAFFTAHLEAHEGATKYQTRCSTVADIFKGTTSSQTKIRCDACLANHFTFAMGDLNFRTKLPDLAAGSPEHIEETHKMAERQDWRGIYDHDELCNALKKKHCFAGFSTPMCVFPPTFKVHREIGYKYNEKRSPSYTDRILYYSGHRLHTKIQCLAYEPIDNFSSSDHKPIRGAFQVELNPILRSLPSIAKRPVTRTSLRREDVKAARLKKFKSTKTMSEREYLHLFITSLRVKINKEMYKSAEKPSPFVCFVSTPAEALRRDTKKWEKVKRVVGRSAVKKNLKNSDGAQAWPKTKRKKNTFEAHWEEEEVHFEVRTHEKNGTPIDLSGALIHVTVFDGKTSGKLVGTFTLNLASLIMQSRKNPEDMKRTAGENRRQRRTKSKRLMRSPKFAKSIRNLIPSTRKYEERKRRMSREESPMRTGAPPRNASNATAEHSHNGDHSNSHDPLQSPRGRQRKSAWDIGPMEGSALLNDVYDYSTNDPDPSHRHDDDEIEDTKEGRDAALRKQDGEFTRGPSADLVRKASWKSRRGLQRMLSRVSTSFVPRGGSLKDLGIQSIVLDEPLRKYGVEVGKISLTIDSWWISDEAVSMLGESDV